MAMIAFGSALRCISKRHVNCRAFATKAVSFQFPTDFKYHKLPEKSIPSKASATQEELMSYFKDMTVIRRMEMMADGMYKAKEIRGFCHLAIGQESIPVGMEAAITRDDSIITAYRCHGFTYIRGASVESILGELAGKDIGVSKGKGGSMHMFTREFYGGNGIVGAQVPVGAGIGLAHGYLKNGRVCFSMYGDGAANQGQVFEAYNMAKLYKAPVIFVCENNMYSMGTSVERSSASREFYTRGDYVPGIKVNGNDVLAVREACRFAKQYALKEGPLVLEMVTYRYQGHSMSDPGTTYRTREEVQNMRASSDPIQLVKQRILDANFATEDELKSIEKEVKEQVDMAAKKTREAQLPTEKELWTDIYVEGTEPDTARGCTSLDIHHFRS